MKTELKIIRTDAGWYAVMFWDKTRNDWSCFWSGSKRIEDAIRIAESINKKFAIE